MKFGEQLEMHKIPEWSSEYFNYKGVKKRLKTLLKAYKSSGKSPLPDPESDTLFVAAFPKASVLDSHNHDDPLLKPEDLVSMLFAFFNTELEKINEFYLKKKAEFLAELEDVMSYVRKHKHSFQTLLPTSDHYDPRQRLNSLLRALQKAHRNFWCLEVYSEINYLACIKSTKKVRKWAKVSTEKLWSEKVLKSNFMKWKELQAVRKQIYAFAAELCSHGDLTKAKTLIRQGEVTYSTTDVAISSFCLGVSLVAFIESIILMAELGNMNTILPCFAVFRLSLSLVFMLWMAAAVIYVFEKYSVNWLYIFEIKVRSTISYFSIIKFASVFTALWSSMFMARFALLDLWPGTYDYVSVVMLVSFVGILFMPLDLFYLPLRKAVAMTLFHILISPFGRVEFRHFFVADVVTSLAKPLGDLYLSTCYVLTDAWKHNTMPDCSHQQLFLFILTGLPYWFRLLQCLNRYYYTRQAFPHLYNAGKYISGIVVVVCFYNPFISNTGAKTAVWVVSYLVATGYMMVWDIGVDWGLVKLESRLKLRKKQTYPLEMYMIAVVSDIILRFGWTLSVLPLHFLQNPLMDVNILLVIVSLLEIARRAQWTIFRVENEKFSNVEKYRQVDFVPKLPRLIID